MIVLITLITSKITSWILQNACGYLCERALIRETFNDNTKQFNRLSHQTEFSEDKPNEFTQVYTIMQNWAQETGQELSQVYAAMNSSPPLCDNLMIPSALWNKLAPEIKKAIMDTRRIIQQDQVNPPPLDSRDWDQNKNSRAVPRQYPNATKTNHVHLDTALASDDSTDLPTSCQCT